MNILRLEVGKNIMQMGGEDQQGPLVLKLQALLNKLTMEYGWVIPEILIQENLALELDEYRFMVRNIPCLKSQAMIGHFKIPVALAKNSVRKIPKGTKKFMDPLMKMECYWVKEEDLSTEWESIVIEAVDDIIRNVETILFRQADKILTLRDIMLLIERVREQEPYLVNGLVPEKLMPHDLRKIFANLLQERVPITDVTLIFERIGDYARFGQDPNMLSEQVRNDLGWQITLPHCDDHQVLYGIYLDKEWERVLDDSCKKDLITRKTTFLIEPEQLEILQNYVIEAVQKGKISCGRLPVMICTPTIRRALYQNLASVLRQFPDFCIISQSEIPSDMEIKRIETLHWSKELQKISSLA